MPRSQLSVLRGAGAPRHAEPADSALLGPWVRTEQIGRSVPRVEAAAKTTGGTRYAADLRLPRQLYAAVLRCPHPHARLVGIDTARAEALPGVHAAISAANTDETPWHRSKLFDRHLRYAGDEVAAVAAESRQIAEDALRLVDAEYERLPFVVDPERALAPDAPHVHAGGNAVGEPETYSRGDPDSGFAAAATVLERVYTTPTALHNCLEPHGCTARWDGGSLTVWESTQGIHAIRDALGEALGLGAHELRVIAFDVGGGFGSKLVMGKHTVIAALLARRAGRPVQLVLDRFAENLATGNRNATRQRVKLGADTDGRLTAIEADILAAVGADTVGGESSDVAGAYQRLYRCPSVRTRQQGVFVNTGPASPFRAPGYVEGAFALESAVDELARELGIDPVELRLRNYAYEDQVHECPYSSPNGLRDSLERVTDAAGWFERRPERRGARRRGLGIAAHTWGGSGSPPAYAEVRLNHDGTAEVMTASQDIGTGTRTALAQIAAEELGLPLADVAVHVGDTHVGPYAPMSGGSATLSTVGPAVRAAAADVRAKLLETAADVADLGPAGALTIRDGAIERHDGARRLTVADLIARIRPRMLVGVGARSPNPSDLSVRTFGAQCAEVEVDVETGEVSVLRVTAAHDVGRIVNPLLAASQIAGGIVQGTGFALMERRSVDAASGAVLNANLEAYLVPTAADTAPVEHAAVDVEDGLANSIGTKGLGEPPIIPTAPAIANAVFDAVGIRIRDLPLSRRRVLDALTEAAARA